MLRWSHTKPFLSLLAELPSSPEVVDLTGTTACNIVLVCNRKGQYDNAVHLATRLLEDGALTPRADIVVKLLYRRAMAYKALTERDKALDDLKKAKGLSTVVSPEIEAELLALSTHT